MGDADGDCSVGYEVLQDACESGMYIEAEYFVFESSSQTLLTASETSRRTTFMVYLFY